MPDEPLTESPVDLRSLGAEIDNSDSEASEDSQPSAVEKQPDVPREVNQPPAEGAEKPKPESADTPAEEKQLSKYEKAKQRQAEAWKKIESEKAEIARQRSELESQRPKEQARSTFKHEGYTAGDYERAARNAMTEAQKHRESMDEESAAQAERFAQEFHQQAQTTRQLEHRDLWNQSARKAAEEMPELRDPKSPVMEQLGKLLESAPLFKMHPDGARLAPQFVKAQIDAAAVPALKAKVEELSKENERLVKLTSLSGSRPAKQSEGGEKTPTRDSLKAMAQEYDGG